MQNREFTADPIDSADYYIESVIDDHVRDAMRSARKFLLVILVSVMAAVIWSDVWLMECADSVVTNLNFNRYRKARIWQQMEGQ